MIPVSVSHVHGFAFVRSIARTSWGGGVAGAAEESAEAHSYVAAEGRFQISAPGCLAQRGSTSACDRGQLERATRFRTENLARASGNRVMCVLVSTSIY